jgi:hypothetical protein
MAHKAVEIAVEARLRAGTALPVFVENVIAEAPADGSAFLILQFPVASVERWPVNQRVYRETGAFRIVAHVPTGTGTDQIRDLGEQLAAIFCDQTFDGVNCRVPGPPFIDDSVEGPLIWASIVFPYDFTFNR